jgi:glycosyltransferase involved in cell wall biosynthesis
VHAQAEGLYASLAVNCDLPSVFTIHGVGLKELQLIKKRIGLIRYLLSTRMIKQHYKKARNIVVINEYTRKAIEGLHNAQIKLIHNAVDEHFFSLFDRDRPKPGHLLQVGGARVRKDVLTAMAAIVWLRENNITVKLDIVGANDSASLQRANEFIQRHNLSPYVTIHGLVSAEDLDELYQHADILMMSSIEESSPISIVQGMAAGKPIVSTDVGGIGEMIREGENGFLVEAGDSDSLGERISRLLADRNLRSNFARTSRRLAVDEWSTKAVALKTFEMYKEMQNGK